MDEVEAIERMRLVLDAAVHVYASLGTCLTLEWYARMDDLGLLPVRGDVELFTPHDCHQRERRAMRFPAARAAANVIEGAIGAYAHRDCTLRALAGERA